MRLQRTSLVAYQSAVVTPDTAEVLRLLETNATKIGGIRIVFKGVPRQEVAWEAPAGPTGYPPHLSLRPAGREVYLRARLTSFKGSPQYRLEAELAALWGLAIPLGLTPWLRYPIPGPGDEVFHCFGPWKPLFDHLCSEGRGEQAWASVCAAAQTDVGTWNGPKKVERFIQAQLHRMGLPCGPVDGEIGERTAEALRALGVQGSVLEETAQTLARYKTPVVETTARRFGQIVLPGDDLTVVTYGQVSTTRTRQGVSLTVDGPGKVILNIGDEV